MEKPEITNSLQMYNSFLEYQNNIEDLRTSILVLEHQVQCYYLDAKSDLAKISPEYKEKSLHKADIKLRARARLKERFNKQLDKLRDHAEERFIQRLHEVQAFNS